METRPEISNENARASLSKSLSPGSETDNEDPYGI